MSKIKLCIFFGGSSTEHEISILSTESVIKNLDASKYEILPVAVTKKGEFVVGEASIIESMPDAGSKLQNARKRENSMLELCKNVPVILGCDLKKYVDVAFPLIHGYLGEDGALQGMLRAFQIPFVGCDILGSAINMDKAVEHVVLKSAGLPVVKYLVLHSKTDMTYAECVAKLGDVLFVKSADLGSSVGVSKVRNEAEYQKAIDDSFQYSNTVVVEEFFQGHEVECAVLGNKDNVQASCCGEIVLHSDFYSYDAKYVDEDAAEVVVPTSLPDSITNKLRKAAIDAFCATQCNGMARVDFLVKDNGEFVINELNTIPGFTNISMYPKAWQASGIQYSELLDKLICLAIDRYNQELKLKRSYKAAVSN